MNRRALKKEVAAYIERIKTGDAFGGALSADEKMCAACIIESMAPVVLRNSKAIGISLIEIEDAIFSYVLARRADLAALMTTEPVKEKIEMSIKSRERLRKFNSEYRAAHPSVEQAKRPIIGLPTRYKELAIRTAGIAEAAIAETRRLECLKDAADEAGERIEPNGSDA